MRVPVAAAIVIFGANLSAGCAVSNRRLPDGATASLRGVITEATPSYLDIRTKPGNVVRVRLDSATRFIARDHAVSRECAATGTRLEARSVLEGGSWKATDVTIFSGECARRQPTR